MHTLPYQNYIFDLYGTLVDIHTDEDQPAAWAALARFYSYYGARYAPDELRAVYLSSDCGCKKPDRRFFRLLLDEQRLDPARSIMVGNDPVCDAAGARDAGLDVLYVHSNLSPAGPLPEATFVLPEMDIPRMGAILAGEVQPS